MSPVRWSCIALGLAGCSWFGTPDDSGERPDSRPDDTGNRDDTGADRLCARDLSEAPPSNECVTDSIGCGETVEATLAGGLSEWVDSNYAAAFCFTNLGQNDYAGPERIYALELPAATNATVTLHTPCADLDLSAVRWERDTCPDDTDPLADCEGSDRTGDDTVSFSWDDTSNWLLVVDAKASADGGANFRLSVSCE